MFGKNANVDKKRLNSKMYNQFKLIQNFEEFNSIIWGTQPNILNNSKVKIF